MVLLKVKEKASQVQTHLHVLEAFRSDTVVSPQPVPAETAVKMCDCFIALLRQ